MRWRCGGELLRPGFPLPLREGVGERGFGGGVRSALAVFPPPKLPPTRGGGKCCHGSEPVGQAPGIAGRSARLHSRTWGKVAETWRWAEASGPEGAGLAEAARGSRLCRAHDPAYIRWLRRPAGRDGGGGDRRGVRRRRRLCRADQPGHQHAGADIAGSRHRRAEEAVDRKDDPGRCHLVPGIFGTRRRQRPRFVADARRARGTDTSWSTARRSGPVPRTTPT